MGTNKTLLDDLNQMIKFDFFRNNPIIADIATNDNNTTPNPYEPIINKCFYYDFSSFAQSYHNHNEPIFLSTNIQCLPSKFESLKNYVLSLINENLPFYVIALQEIWHIPAHANLNIPGFKFIHSTRKNSKGGGVGFYLKNDLPHKIIPELSHFDSLNLHLIQYISFTQQQH
jgi:hypothetical protein